MDFFVYCNFCLKFPNKYSCGLNANSVGVENFVDVRGESNYELVMRLDSNINTGRTLHTDLNGLTITPKKYHEKLHIQEMMTKFAD